MPTCACVSGYARRMQRASRKRLQAAAERSLRGRLVELRSPFSWGSRRYPACRPKVRPFLTACIHDLPREHINRRHWHTFRRRRFRICRVGSGVFSCGQRHKSAPREHKLVRFRGLPRSLYSAVCSITRIGYSNPAIGC